MRTMIKVDGNDLGWIEPKGERWVGKRYQHGEIKGKEFDQASEATAWVRANYDMAGGKTRRLTPSPESSTQTKVWVNNDLLEFVDAICERDERSRSFVINQALAHWVSKLQRDRKNRASRVVVKGGAERTTDNHLEPSDAPDQNQRKHRTRTK